MSLDMSEFASSANSMAHARLTPAAVRGEVEYRQRANAPQSIMQCRPPGQESASGQTIDCGSPSM